MAFEFRRRVRRAKPADGSQGVVGRYGLAVATVVAATGMRFALKRVVGVYEPYLPFALAVALTALFGGRGPGMAANALGAVVVAWFFLEPAHAFADPAAAWALALFVVFAQSWPPAFRIRSEH